jgi:CubicO group peptidase (beta-lactamase class C family)
MTIDPVDLLPTTTRALQHRLARGQAEGRAPSLVAGVVRGGRLVWSGGCGSVDRQAPTTDTQYRIGSITKTFVAVLVMRLRNEGLVDLSAPLDTYLPGTAAGDRSIRQLLSHTAGIASETPPPWWERTSGDLRPELADILGESALKHAPGQRFHYSNPGYGLLGALVGRLRGRAWSEVLTEEVLLPLGMTRTTAMPEPPHALGWAVHPWADVLLPEPTPDAGLMAPAGQLWSTVQDLTRYAAFLMAGDERVLPRATLEEMREPVAPGVGGTDASGYGLGLQLFPGARSWFGHGGSMPGFLAGLGCSPEEDLGAVVYANATSGPAVAAILADLIATVAEAEPRMPTSWQPVTDFDPGVLALTGPWYWGAAPFALRMLPDRGLELITLGKGGRESRFRAQSDGTWLGLDNYYAGETLRVVRDGAGEVTHLDLGSFVLTREPYPTTGVVPGGVEADGWTGTRG